MSLMKTLKCLITKFKRYIVVGIWDSLPNNEVREQLEDA